jgi:hypothetical protein
MDLRLEEPLCLLDPRFWLLAPFPLIFPLKSGRFPVWSSLLYGEESLD